MQTRKQIALLEELAANAWPAETVQSLDGWRMRFTGGRSRRINSVWPNLELGDIPLDEKLDLVEDFYQRKEKLPRYQMCPAAQPENLAGVLEEQGYTADAHTQVQISTLGFVLPRIESGFSGQVEVNAQLPDEWLDFYAEVENYTPERKTIRRGVLERIGPLAGFAALHNAGNIIAIGLGVVERGWLGLFCMLTHPGHRRQGAATAVLQALGNWGQEARATHTYLQVMENNPTALAMYARVGYKHLYQYYYLEKRE